MKACLVGGREWEAPNKSLRVWVRILRLWGERYRRPPSGWRRTYRFPGLELADLPGTEHLGSGVSRSNTRETHPEGLDSTCCYGVSRIFLSSFCMRIGQEKVRLYQIHRWKKPTFDGLGVWPRKSIRRLPQMAKGQTGSTGWRRHKWMPKYLDVARQVLRSTQLKVSFLCLLRLVVCSWGDQDQQS